MASQVHKTPPRRQPVPSEVAMEIVKATSPDRTTMARLLMLLATSLFVSCFAIMSNTVSGAWEDVLAGTYGDDEEEDED